MHWRSARKKSSDSWLLTDPAANQTKAYENAGFKARGDSARANAAKCLKKIAFGPPLAAGRAERAERSMLTAERVVEGDAAHRIR